MALTSTFWYTYVIRGDPFKSTAFDFAIAYMSTIFQASKHRYFYCCLSSGRDGSGDTHAILFPAASIDKYWSSMHLNVKLMDQNTMIKPLNLCDQQRSLLDPMYYILLGTFTINFNIHS